jgi:hypothetical protein
VLALAVTLSWAGVAPTPCGAQSIPLSRGVLTNNDVILLAVAGFSEDFIIATIQSTRHTHFDTSAPCLVDLAKQGITERIIRVMQKTAATYPRMALGQIISRGERSADEVQAWSTAPPPSATPPFATPASLPSASAAPSSESPSEGKIRVFLELNGDSGPTSSTLWAAGHQSQPAKTVEIMQTFGERCPNLTVTTKRGEADYTIVLERKYRKLIRRECNLLAFDRSGDMAFQTSTGVLSGAVNNLCVWVRSTHPHDESGDPASPPQ